MQLNLIRTPGSYRYTCDDEPAARLGLQHRLEHFLGYTAEGVEGKALMFWSSQFQARSLGTERVPRSRRYSAGEERRRSDFVVSCANPAHM